MNQMSLNQYKKFQKKAKNSLLNPSDIKDEYGISEKEANHFD